MWGSLVSKKKSIQKEKEEVGEIKPRLFDEASMSYFYINA